MNPRKLCIELGINLDAAPITCTDPAKNLFPLQNALLDVTDDGRPKPLWYSQLRSYDELSFRLVDITDLLDPQTPASRPTTVKIRFADPVTGKPLDPFEQAVSGWKLDPTSTLRFSPVYSAPAGRDLPTWNLLWQSGNTWHDGPLTLAATGQAPFRGFEMSMALEVHRGSEVSHYVFDPEMIVSETG